MLLRPHVIVDNSLRSKVVKVETPRDVRDWNWEQGANCHDGYSNTKSCERLNWEQGANCHNGYSNTKSCERLNWEQGANCHDGYSNTKRCERLKLRTRG